MTRIKSVIFDLDGTLVDSAPGIIDCFRQVLADRALHPIRPLNASLIGPPLRDTLRTLTGLADEDPLLDNLAEDFKTHYDDSACHTTPEYAGISSVLKSISARGISLHIATNKRIIPTRRIVEHLGWNPLFSSIYARDSFSPPLKSKAQLIQRLLDEQAIDFQDAIYVGDTQDDGKAALENQMPFWAALWGYGQFDCLEETGFFRLLSKPEDIVKKLSFHE
jgi:phosphoglycolate phosphatase